MLKAWIGTVVVAGCAMLAPAASGSVRTVAFDDLADGTEISTQYASQGVVFDSQGFPGTPPAPATCNFGRPQVATIPARAFSPPNVAQSARCGPVEFGSSGSMAKVVRSRSVSVRVGHSSAGQRQARMEAFNGAGEPVAVTDATVGPGTNTEMEVSSPFADIEWIALYMPVVEQGGRMEFDNFAFDALESTDPPPPPPQPDFLITHGEPGRILAVTPGGRGVSFVAFRRLRGSTGPIALSARDLPPRTTATFSPQPYMGGDQGTAAVTIAAATDAPPVTRASVTIVGTPESPSTGSQERTATIPVTVGSRIAGFDIRVKGIEVTQGIQPPGFLVPSGRAGDGGDYRGPSLAVHGKTVARVYADVTGAPSTGVPGVGMLLSAFRDGREIGPFLFPIYSPRVLQAQPFDGVGPAERQDPAGAYTFLLPHEWTHGNVALRAGSLPPPAPYFGDEPSYEECRTRECSDNNRIALRNIRYTPTRTFFLDVLDLQTKNATGTISQANIGDLFAVPLAVTPTGENKLIVRGPRAVIRNRDDALNQATSEWFRDSGRPGDAAMGVEILPSGGGGGQAWPNDRTAIASAGRPFTALSHELFHLFSAHHASACNGGGNPAKPSEKGTVYDDWPPDQRGLLTGLVLDRRGRSGDTPFGFLSPSSTFEVFDFMSYCAGDDNSWVSPFNWEKVLGFLRQPGTSGLGAAQRRRGSRLAVTATVTDSGTAFDVAPATGSAGPRGTVTSYHAIARDAAGQTLSDVALLGDEVHDRLGGSLLVAEGEVPAAAAQVDLVLEGTVLASRRRSASAPQLRLISPRRGARLSGRGRITVRWRASDADGDLLRSSVDYSRDGGRHWSTIGMAGADHSLRIPAALFARSANGRVRVRVHDGFRSATAVSKRIVAAGSLPSVDISDPVTGQRIPADGTLQLTGIAIDDRFARLRGRRLSWYVGRRLLGHGESVSVMGSVKPGRRRVRLVARDAVGRRGSAAVRVRVMAVVPRFLALRAPRRVSRRARRVPLRVATSLPATLRVGHNRFAVGRGTRTLRLPVARGRRKLTLSLVLEAGGRRTRASITIRRR